MDIISYSLSKKIAASAVSGVSSMSVDGTTLNIDTNDGQRLQMVFPQPKDGVSVTDIDVNANNQIVFTMSDGTEFISGKIPTVKGDKGDPFKYSDFTTEQLDSLKGSDGFSPSAKIEKVGDTATITITDKDGTTTATIKDGQGGSGGSGEENKIDSISVNGVNVSPDENKNVDITVPSIDGLAKTEDIPTKVSELTNDSGYLTEHQDISGKVDKVDGKSLIADTEIERLASVDNYDDTDIKAEIAKKADATAVPSKVSELTNDSNYQTAEQVNSTVTTEIAKVVADAPEDLNTLKEMSDWIAGHEDDASAMNSAISDNKTAIASLQTGKADKSEIPTTVAELTDSADYAKTADIPTTLPANGGNADTVNNHTIETDVPTDAVFTDTIYDDTEVKKRISDNGYGEVAGGKNLLNHNIIDSEIRNCSVLFKNDTFYVTNKGNYSYFVLSVPTIVGKSYTVTIKDWSDYSYRCIASVSDLSDNTLASMIINDATLSMTFTAVGTESLIRINPNNTQNEMSNTITFKCMLEEGSVATEYEPYFPSNKMLSDEVSVQNESLSVIGKCKNLLKPALATTTQNGVTCTNNGDGTYTLDTNGGTSTKETYFVVTDSSNSGRLSIQKYKLVGCRNGSTSTFNIEFYNVDKWGLDIGDGLIIDPKVERGYRIRICIQAGVTLDNVVFKPMLTTNLNATYDDFVPYTGDGETLASDVAEIKNDLAPKKIELQNVDERVTIQDNGSFIINGFAFVNLLVTFNETLQQWSNFVRLPRPKGSNVSVHCENSVRFAIYSQDNLPGDCGTTEEVSSGTEVRLLVNYEVA